MDFLTIILLGLLALVFVVSAAMIKTIGVAFKGVRKGTRQIITGIGKMFRKK